MSLINEVEESDPVTVYQAKSKNNSYKKYKKRYYKKLFLETDFLPILLSDVYVEPAVTEKNEYNRSHYSKNPDSNRYRNNYDNAIKYIKNRIVQNKGELIFVEGKAGVGKSSLLARLASMSSGENEYYISLKDFLKYKEINLKEVIFSTYNIDQDATDLIFFLDGIDEIVERIDKMQMVDDFQSLIEAGCYIICTVRPGYIDYSRLGIEYHRIEIEPFDEYKRSLWLNKYKAKLVNPEDIVIDSLGCIHQYDSIIGIPIMLYIIARKNIDIRKVRSMPQLYTILFEKLKDDKSSRTKISIDHHYDIAKQIAFKMECEGKLSIDRRYIEEEIDMDPSFYSSVYMETVIDGEQYLEFVHKSIQEFFAAQCIIQLFLEKEFSDIFVFCGRRLFSEEVLFNINHLVDEKSEIIICDKICQYVRAGFPYRGTGKINYCEYNNIMKITVKNIFALIQTLQNCRLSILNGSDVSLQALFSLVYDVKNIYKDTKYPTLKEVVFKDSFFRSLKISGFEFYSLFLCDNEFDRCVFNSCSFYQCKFLIDGGKESDIVFQSCNFVMPLFRYTRRTLREKTNIRFIDCTFTFYESKNKTAIESTKSFIKNQCHAIILDKTINSAMAHEVVSPKIVDIANFKRCHK